VLAATVVQCSRSQLLQLFPRALGEEGRPSKPRTSFGEEEEQKVQPGHKPRQVSKSAHRGTFTVAAFIPDLLEIRSIEKCSSQHGDPCSFEKCSSQHGYLCSFILDLFAETVFAALFKFSSDLVSFCAAQ